MTFDLSDSSTWHAINGSVALRRQRLDRPYQLPGWRRPARIRGTRRGPKTDIGPTAAQLGHVARPLLRLEILPLSNADLDRQRGSFAEDQ